jgi:hypothetical protein
MSNRPKLQKARISNREMARDTKTLIESGVEMCKLLAFIHDKCAAKPTGGPFNRYAQRKDAMNKIAAMTLPWRGFKVPAGDGIQ